MTAEANRSARRAGIGRLLLRAAVLAAAFVALVAFSVVLAKLTLTPSPASEDIVTSNLRPGRSLRQYAEDYTFLAACKQAGGNILMGTPFGVLLPILVPRRLRMIRMTVLTVLVMAVVELTQGALVAGRAFDIDDVILNTTGALLGYALVGRRISHRYHALSDGPAAAEEAEAKPGPRTSSRKKPAAERGAKPATATKPATTTKTRAKAAETKPRGSGSGSAARRSASAPTARGRALLDRWRGRREGPGGGAPGARRRGA
ncbi:MULTISPECIES: VanZ family protein [unclassified Streptomyces]|uniref:VanZ family protein n=1 Tax=unclassified Streptomyces TaxID=2593676 RepID=UPI000C0861FC|nr:MULTISPECIES: VanZ family protein [unclassified Streptomyces]MYQ40836.1 VanZ family protein [Streptomyces sp. SID4921]